MGWEKRGKGLYYYSKERTGKHVVSRYVGKGLGTEHLASLIEELREVTARKREQKRRDIEILRVIQEATDAPLKSFEEALRPCVEAFLIACGYHCHRGEWRRKRESRKR
jgi:hypothetical protein